ncbi:hypothetical protein C8T65DRAFT_629396, partial [Cerioporus squamosus]
MAEAEACVDCKPDSQPFRLHQHNPLDPSTFIPPSPSITPTESNLSSVLVNSSARRLHRATWTSTELFLTFPTPAIKAISIMPLNAEDTAGRFRVWLFLDGKPPVLVWDRKVEGGFPELKFS